MIRKSLRHVATLSDVYSFEAYTLASLVKRSAITIAVVLPRLEAGEILTLSIHTACTGYIAVISV